MSAKGTSKNDVTGDKLITKKTTDAYRDGYDAIFKKKEKDRSKCVCKDCKCAEKKGFEQLTLENV